MWPIQTFLRNIIDTSATGAQVDVHHAYLLFKAGRLMVAVAFFGKLAAVLGNQDMQIAI